MIENRADTYFPTRCELGFSLLITLFISLLVSCAYGLSDAELETIRAGYDERRDTYLNGYLNHSFYEMDEGMGGMRSAISTASWIWHPESKSGLSTPAGKRYFRRSFTLPESPALKKAYAAFSCDNFADIEANGHSLGSAHGFNRATLVDLSTQLKPGDNVINVTAHNMDHPR